MKPFNFEAPQISLFSVLKTVRAGPWLSANGWYT